jgi:hypothetical protein
VREILSLEQANAHVLPGGLLTQALPIWHRQGTSFIHQNYEGFSTTQIMKPHRLIESATACGAKSVSLCPAADLRMFLRAHVMRIEKGPW